MNYKFLTLFLLYGFFVSGQKVSNSLLTLKREQTLKLQKGGSESFDLQVDNQIKLRIIESDAGTKVTLNDNSFTIEKLNPKVVLFKNLKEELIGMKRYYDGFELIGFNKRIFRVEEVERNVFKVWDAERDDSNYGYNQNLIRIDAGKQSIRIETNLKEIPIELLAPIYVRRYKYGHQKELKYSDSNSNKNSFLISLGLGAIAAIIGLLSR